MRQFAVILLFALGFAQQSAAQAFLGGLREGKSGQGTVTVTQSPEIDELVNNAKLTRSQPAPTPSEKANTAPAREAKPAARSEKADRTPAEATHANRATAARESAESESPTVDTSKKVMRGGRKITGYRVQAYSGGNSRADRQRAERIGNAIKMRFPDLPIYVHFYSPRWICRVGNFRTYQEANEVLQEIKGMGYRQACIVKGKITVRY